MCVIQYEETLILPLGKKTFHTTLFPVIYDGKVVNIVGSGRDITEQKMIEDSRRIAEEKIRVLNESIAYESLKTEFFANLSHELRTPLNVIFSSMQMLNVSISNCSDQTTKNIATKYFKSMKQNCFRLLRLVNNLIDISKVDSGYFDLNLENTDIVSLVENITLSVAEYIESKSISLIFDTEIEEKVIALDPEKMERIMLNLLSNATKFTDSGGQVLVYICQREDKIVISVKDSGIGIPEEKLEVIFVRFTQVDKSLTRKREGSGIGLYLVKSLVELHGGNITVNSRVGEGSEFTIGLPAKLIDESEEKSIYKDNCNGGMVERINIEFSDIYS
jgi:signal transduction histidine kinase